MPQLRTNNSLQEQSEKSHLQRLLKGMASFKSSVLNSSSQQTTGTQVQSMQMGLASAFGLGGAYVAASKISKKVKELNKGIKALYSAFSGDSDDVEAESVFTNTEQTKQPGFFGIAGLAKYGFTHLVKAIKKKKTGEEKDKKSFLQKLFEGLGKLFKSKWFWGTLLASALGFGLWNLVSGLVKDKQLLEAQTEAANNRTLIDDPDFLAEARENELIDEFEANLQGIYDAKDVVKRKWNKDLDNLIRSKIPKEKPQYVYTSSEVLKSRQLNPNISLPRAGNVPVGQAIPLNTPLPAGSYTISSRFGYRNLSKQNRYASKMHQGIDLAAKAGTPVIAPAQGIVSKVGYDRKSGNYIKIQHKNGYETVYAHLQSMNVTEKQRLSGGEIIGQVGNTGIASTGAHLHFGIKKNGQFVNPEPFLQQETSLTSGAPAFNTEMSSNIQESEDLTKAVSESQQQLAKSYKALDEAIQYNINHPLYLITLRKFGRNSLITRGVRAFGKLNRAIEKNKILNDALSMVPGGTAFHALRKLFY